MLSSSPVLADVSPGRIHGRCEGCGAAREVCLGSREVCLGSQPAHGQGHAKYRLVSNPVSRVAQTPASARRLAPCEEVADQRREAARHSLEAQPWSQSESCRGPGHASTSYRAFMPNRAKPVRSGLRARLLRKDYDSTRITKVSASTPSCAIASAPASDCIRAMTASMSATSMSTAT